MAYGIFKKIFFWCGPFLKCFIEFVTIPLLLYVLIFCPWGMWDLSFLARDGTHTPCTGRHSLNHSTIGEVLACRIFQLQQAGSWFMACGIFNCIMCDLSVTICRIFSCGMWDLVPWREIKLWSPAFWIWNLSHWITRKVPKGWLLSWSSDLGWFCEHSYPWLFLPYIIHRIARYLSEDGIKGQVTWSRDCTGGQTLSPWHNINFYFPGETQDFPGPFSWESLALNRISCTCP